MNKIGSFVVMQMNLESAKQSEISHKEKNKHGTLMHIYRIQKNGTDGTYLQGRNRDRDIENKLVDTVGKGEDGMSLESNIDTYTLQCVKQIASGTL